MRGERVQKKIIPPKITTKYKIKQDNIQPDKDVIANQTRENESRRYLWCLQFFGSVHVRAQKIAGYGASLGLYCGLGLVFC